MDLVAAEQYIASLDYLDPSQHSYRYAAGNGIARTRHVLQRLGGAPHSTQACVLVTGSKGKGSTSMMIGGIVSAAGYRCGVSTGPHLHSILERYLIDGVMMTPQRYIDYAQQIRRIIETWDQSQIGLPTRFEVSTAMAYHWFDESGCDLSVMEIGIGGKNDAVNLAEPSVSVFTNISLEHTQMLGNTVAQIAREKAGIMCARGVAISARQRDEVRAVLAEEARALGCPIYFADEQWQLTHVRNVVQPDSVGQWVRARSHGDALDIFLPLLGSHQLENCAAALAAVDALRNAGFDISANAIQRGLKHVQWRGRFEVLQQAPMLVADGAHTPYSMQRLGEALREVFGMRRITLALGVLRDKDAAGIVESALQFADQVIFVTPSYHRALPAEQLRAAAKDINTRAIRTRVIQPLEIALRAALDEARADDVICVSGSLHLVAQAHKFLA